MEIDVVIELVARVIEGKTTKEEALVALELLSAEPDELEHLDELLGVDGGR